VSGEWSMVNRKSGVCCFSTGDFPFTTISGAFKSLIKYGELLKA